MIWEKLTTLSDKIEDLFDKHFDRQIQETDLCFEGWQDLYWDSHFVRKCHIQKINKRESQKLMLLHITIFPKTHLSTPILGFDVVAGQNKITGSFFDYSPIGQHIYLDYFKNEVSKLGWNKPRELPDWAKSIFSENMLAVGNLKEESEVDQLCDTAFSLIAYYVENLGKNNHYGIFKERQNYYCSQQKKNPHLHRSMLAMGITEEQKDRYINEVLFQELE